MVEKELIKAISEKTGLTQKDVKVMLDAFQETAIETLQKGDKIKLVGFGTFKVVEAKAREARNPKTGEKIPVPAHKSPKFKFSEAVKDLFK